MTPDRSTEPSGPTEAPPAVLIVDDRPENLIALAAILEPLDVRVVRASSGTEAVSLCEREEFAVVVLDVMMPGKDGPETARLLKRRGASRLTPIIFLTAMDADRRRVHDGYASGAVDYLFKPVDPDVLRAKVAAFTELHRNRRAEHWQQRRRYADQAAQAAAAALREGDERFRLLAEAVPVMVWTATPDGRADYVNPFTCAYLGVPDPSAVTGDRWTTFLHPDDAPHAQAQWQHSCATGAPYEAEIRIWNAERNAYRRHISRAAPRRNGNGSIVGWVVASSDVEDSKRAEEEAHELLLTAERSARLASDGARAGLARAVERTARLQALTAALSEAATPADVARAVTQHGVAALGASAGLVATIESRGPERGDRLCIIGSTGYPTEVVDRWRTIPLDADIPLAAAARTQEPVLICGARERAEAYPALASEQVVFPAAYALPLVADGAAVGAIGFSFATVPTLTDDDRLFADAIARQCAQALRRAELFAAERRARAEEQAARQRVTFLFEAGAALSESLDYQESLQTLVRIAVPFLADYAMLDVTNADGAIERIAFAHVERSKQGLIEASARHYEGVAPDKHPVYDAMIGMAPRLLAHMDDAAYRQIARNDDHLAILRQLAPRSMIAVPMIARGRALGVMMFAMSVSGRTYDESDLALAEELVRRASVAVDTARLYEEAQEANRAKAAFLAAVSHDLRQPLNASLGFLDIALMGLRGEVTSTLREDLERVRRNQQHLLALINDVLSFARVEAGQLIVRRDIVALEHVLDALPSLVAPQADLKGVRLEIRPHVPPAHVLGDHERVLQIFTNLLTNAIKATPRGGRVSVHCDMAGDVVLARVSDTGIGIAEDMHERIFEPFVQVARSLNRPEEGIGLGLAISRNLARAMGGELTLESSLGSGSTFTVRLPRAAASPSAIAHAAVPSGAR